MPTTVSLYEAKTHLSELGERAAQGEEIVVTKHGKPRFMIVPVPAAPARALPGSIDVNLTATDEELERAFGMRE